MRHTIAIHIPCEIKGCMSPTTQRWWTEQVVKQFVDHVGGCLVIQGIGFWKSSERGTIQEPIDIVKCQCDDNDFATTKTLAYEMAETIADAMSQDSVAVTVDGCMELVQGKHHPEWDDPILISADRR